MEISHDDIAEELAQANEEALLADGFEDALIGYVEIATKPVVALYDRQKCIEILMKRDGMTEEGAEEFFSFNTIGAYMGESAPAFATIKKK
jgi:hypothetical protein